VYGPMSEISNNPSDQELVIEKCTDFEIDGKGDNNQWDKTDWTHLHVLDDTDQNFETKFKMLYSNKGIYVSGYCEDKIISTDYSTDQGDIWNGDVFEVFLQFDPSDPLYFEYEINPLNTELVILVPNNQGDFFGWLPWHYEGDRKIKKAVQVHDGASETGAKISGWTIEVFFPYALFKGIKNIPPKAGTKWKGNFYRMDYDTKKQIKWSWAPVGNSFHEYQRFGTILFK